MPTKRGLLKHVRSEHRSQQQVEEVKKVKEAIPRVCCNYCQRVSSINHITRHLASCKRRKATVRRHGAVI